MLTFSQYIWGATLQDVCCGLLINECLKCGTSRNIDISKILHALEEDLDKEGVLHPVLLLPSGWSRQLVADPYDL